MIPRPIRRAIRAACLLGTLALAACAQAPQPDAMAPVPASTPAGTIAQAPAPALLVQPVSGGKATDPLEKPALDGQGFQAALIAGLRRSGLFRDVITAGPAGWTLRAVIVSQAMDGTFRVSEDLMIRYDLSDGSGGALWGETVVSRCERDVADDFDGQTRMRKVIECAARRNLTAMLTRLRGWLETHPAGSAAAWHRRLGASAGPSSAAPSSSTLGG